MMPIDSYTALKIIILKFCNADLITIINNLIFYPRRRPCRGFSLYKEVPAVKIKIWPALNRYKLL